MDILSKVTAPDGNEIMLVKQARGIALVLHLPGFYQPLALFARVKSERERYTPIAKQVCEQAGIPFDPYL